MSRKQTNKDNPVVKHLSTIILAFFTVVILSSRHAVAAPTVKSSSVFKTSDSYLNHIYDHRNQYAKEGEGDIKVFNLNRHFQKASQRDKRSLVPLGLVNYGKNCYCSPGDITKCRCLRLISAKSEERTSSSPSKAKRRVTRSKKNKF